MKRIIAILLAALMVASLCACGSKGTDGKDASSFKIGIITLHDENSTYDKNFLDAVQRAKKNLNLTDEQVIIKTNVDESSACYEAAVDMADRGCSVVFADSFGHESYMAQAAEKYPDVQFCHATGTTAHTANLKNLHNAFASIYEGRFMAGVAAGMKLNEMIDAGTITAEQAVIGYVGAYTYAEVISGYTSFFLGARSICPSATMKVQFTGSWYDETAEKEAATTLMNQGCVLISQHADSMGAPTACEAAGVPNISYNGSTVDACPNTFIVSTYIDWTPYFEYIIKCAMEGNAIDTDWVGTIDTGSVCMTDVNEKAAAPGTVEKLKEIKDGLMKGSINVFDTAAFTVGGEKLTSYLADVDTDPDYTPDTEVIIDGIFKESEKRSAPYFDLRIDGIECLNEEY
ncbi:MAG: BMP family ABC transporter substrate-binding protein [Oscillospiraceae bacterium]|nr:BMP family ABC transporter substrate-binding protein [Oscillospiraceae bacterium]